MTSIDRTAYPGFARMVSARELADGFTPAEDEFAWAQEKTTTDQHLLALVVWLKCYQRLRYFPPLDKVPDSVVGHVRGLLGLPEKVAAEVDTSRTAKRHREFVRGRLGVKYESAQVRGIAEAAIRAAAQTKDNPADLINVALEELVRKGRELPGYTTLDKMVAEIRTEVNGKVFTQVASRITSAQRARLAEVLRVDPSNRRSEFDRLKTPAKAATIGKLKLRLAHLAELDALGPTEAWLQGVPPGKISHFAGEAKVTDAADFNKIGEDKRFTLLASLIHVLRTSARDEVTEMFCKRMAVIHKKGRARLEALREEHRVESERLLEVFGEVLAAAREATEPDQDIPEPPPGPVLATRTAFSAPKPRRRATTLARRTPGTRWTSRRRWRAGPGRWFSRLWPRAAAWSSCLPRTRRWPRTTATTTCRCWRRTTDPTGRCCSPWWTRSSWRRPVPSARCWTRWSSSGPTATDAGTGSRSPPSTPATARRSPSPWTSTPSPAPCGSKTLRDRRRPGMLARRHLEVCVFSHLAAELRSGDIAVVGSDSYANLHAQLMTWDECAPQVAEFCEQAGIPADAKALVAYYRALLTKTASGRRQGLPGEHRPAPGGRQAGAGPAQGRRPPAVRAGAGGGDPGPAARAAPAGHPGPHRPPDRLAPPLRAGLRLGPEDPRRPRPVRGHRVRLRREPRADRGRPAHARGQRPRASTPPANKHADPDKIYKASADVINAFAKLDVAAMWGDGQTAAVDGSQIDTWENNLLAESHVRYGGFGGSRSGWCPTTTSRCSRHFIPCGVWEAVYLLDVFAVQRLRHPARHDPRRHPRAVAAGLRPGRAPGFRPASRGSGTGTT